MQPSCPSDESRVVFVTHEYAPFHGGVATFVREISAECARLGAQVEVWCPDRGRSASPDLAKSERFRVRTFPGDGRLTPWSTFGFARLIRREVARQRPRAVALLSIGAIKAGLLGLPRRQSATCVFYGSEILKLRRPSSRLWARALKLRFHAGWKAGCAGNFVARLLQSSGLVGSTPIFQTSCALPESARAAASTSVPRPRHLNAPFRLLTLARLHERKGQLEVAEALRHLPVELKSKLRYEIAGGGDKAYLAAVVAAAGSSGVECVAHGEVDEATKSALYAGCDAYVMASRTFPTSVEGFGLTFLEAGLHELPALGYDSGGAGEAVLHGKTGLLAPEGSQVILAQLITAIVEDPELRQRLGQAGRIHALATSWKPAAASLLNALLGSASPVPLEPDAQ